MAVTATDITREHYLRPEVREIISRFALPGNGTWRALNGDFHRWYRNSTDGRARLLNVCEDYEELVNTYRTLYQTLNVFDPSLWMAVPGRGRRSHPIIRSARRRTPRPTRTRH